MVADAAVSMGWKMWDQMERNGAEVYEEASSSPAAGALFAMIMMW